jgi:phosphinothricin acetyltransferase
MTGTYRIRTAGEADLAGIHGIYSWHVLNGTASFEEQAPDLAEMAARLAAIQARGLPYLCAVDEGGQVAGYAYAGPYRSRSAYRFTVEDSIYIDPQQAGRGLGRLLLTQLIADCQAGQVKQVVAVIGDSANHASIRLHAALGFREVGVLRSVGFKFGRWLDSVLMQREL